MSYHSIKVVDLDDDIPSGQIHELLIEKFADFYGVTVKIVSHGINRVAYVNFESMEDAQTALQENRRITLFGTEHRVLPVYLKPQLAPSAASIDQSSRYSQERDVDDYYHSPTSPGRGDWCSSVKRSDTYHADPVESRASHYSSHSIDLEEPPFCGDSRDRDVHYRSTPMGRDEPYHSQSRSHDEPYRRMPRGQDETYHNESGGRDETYRGPRRGHNEPYHSPPRGGGGSSYRTQSRGHDIRSRSRSRGRDEPYRRSLSKERLENYRHHSRDRGSRYSRGFRGGFSSRGRLTSSGFVGRFALRRNVPPTSGRRLNRTSNSVKPTNTADTSQPNHNLYIGALDAGVTEDDLQRLFQRYGCILHIEKKFSPTGTCYAFVSFLTMDMAIKAREAMLDKFIGSTVPKLGYGTQNVSKSLWVGGIGSWTSIDLLRTEFGQFGEIERIDWPDNRDYAFITYTNSADAKEALQVMHGSMHGDPPREIRVDFANLTQIKSRFNYEPYVKLPPRWRMQRGRSKLVSSHRRSGSYEQKRSRTNESCRSPYNADDISSPSSDDAKSEIKKSSKSSRSKRKKHLSPSSKSPVGKKRLRNPSPPTPSAVLSSEPLESVDVFPRHDERTVVLRSQPVPPPPDVCVAATIQQPLTSMPPPTHVDPVTFYSSIPTSFPPPTYQPPHITPQDFYVPHHPVVSNFLPPVLPQVVSYPPALGHGNPYVPVIDTAASHTVVQPAPEPPKMLPVALSRKDNVASRFPKVWSGALVLKNGAFVVNLHLVSGSVILVDSLLGSSSEPGSVSDCPVLKIAQRLRLDQPDKLDELDRRLFQAGRAQCSVLLACAAPAQVDDVANVIQQRPLEQLVSYLSQKQVAAVVPLPAGCAADNGEAKGVLHAFPPCRFASDFLERDAPGLGSNCPANDQLLVIICNGL